MGLSLVLQIISLKPKDWNNAVLMMVLDEKFQSYYNSSKMSEPNLMAKLIETGGGPEMSTSWCHYRKCQDYQSHYDSSSEHHR